MINVKNQHGDVILFSVDSIPKSAKKIHLKDSLIVERGEGINTHVIDDIENVECFMDNETMYLNVLKDIEIKHEEHPTQVIDAGIYQKRIERQFDYENEIERRVLD